MLDKCYNTELHLQLFLFWDRVSVSLLAWSWTCHHPASGHFVCCGIGVWTQGLTFARKALYHLSHSIRSAGHILLEDLFPWDGSHHLLVWGLLQYFVSLQRIHFEVQNLFCGQLLYQTWGKGSKTPQRQACLFNHSVSFQLPVNWETVLSARRMWLWRLTSHLTTHGSALGQVTCPSLQVSTVSSEMRLSF
jgi:hypothetical protein